MRISQTQSIINWLEQGKSITPIEALNEFGCFRLAARIGDIRKLGYEVKTEMVSVGGKSWASYDINVDKDIV